jgi:hypothetical protein
MSRKAVHAYGLGRTGSRTSLPAPGTHDAAPVSDPGGRVFSTSTSAPKIRLRLVALAAAAVTACATDYPSRVPTGSWGGPHAGMVVSDTGAEIEYDCGAGRITAPLTLDGHGDFDLPGLYLHEGPGPVPANDSLIPTSAAVYAGHTDGKTMTFTMTVTDGSIPPETYTLTFGGNPNVFKCL